MCDNEIDYKAERAAKVKARKLERKLKSKKFAKENPEILELINKLKESNKRMSSDIRKLIRGTFVESNGVRMRYSHEYDFADAVWAGSVSSVEPEGVFKGTGLFELMKRQPVDFGAPDEFYKLIKETHEDCAKVECSDEMCYKLGLCKKLNLSNFNTGLHD